MLGDGWVEAKKIGKRVDQQGVGSRAECWADGWVEGIKILRLDKGWIKGWINGLDKVDQGLIGAG